MRIVEIEVGSIAEEIGIEQGDSLISINGKAPKDVFDYRYLLNDEYVEFCVTKSDGQEYIFEVEKYADEDIGLTFETALMDKVKLCANKCLFCFMDQLPPNMRDSLHYKDDDMRLSFLQGNYVTLTNLSDTEFERLLSYHLSPINISVHATNPELRTRILNNPKAAKLEYYLERFREARIQMNFQIVLMKGINDGEYLDDTIRTLGEFIPFAKSLSVVPVGLSKHREGLTKLEPFTKEDAAKVLEQIEVWNRIFKKEHGTAFVFAADEFYLKAQTELPPTSYYEDFPQIENGVGMLAEFKEEFLNMVDDMESLDMPKRKLSIVTGKAAYEQLSGLANIAAGKFSLDITAFCVDNKLFGEEITVVGLLTGKDILECLVQIPREELGEAVLLPASMFRSGTDIFLDDTTAVWLEAELGVPVHIVETSGYALVQALTY